MTTDQPARTPEETQGEEQAARERAHALLGGAFRRADGAVWFPGLDGDGFDVFVSGLVQELAAHAREVEALRAEVKQLRSEPDMVAEVERDLAALRARIEAAVREDDPHVAELRRWTNPHSGLAHLLSILDATRAANAGLREMLRDIVDGAWADADDKGFKFCIWCQLAHHEDTPAGDDVHERDCQIRAAERALASNSGERT